MIILEKKRKEILEYQKKYKNENYDNIVNKIKKVKDGDSLKIIDIQLLGEKMEEEIKEKINKIKKDAVTKIKKKDYNEEELNELDYDDAIMYDKRSFIQIYCSIFKEKQIIINTFCADTPFRPFSIKLLALLFDFSCYFVINGFLYNEEYVGKLFKKEVSKDISIDLVSDTIERIVYATLLGGLISKIVGVVFNTKNEIDKVIKKKDNNVIILRGEITKIYKCYIIKIISFIIFQFIVMAFFTLYILCFCYVYPNTVLDWTETSLIVIGVMQSFSFFTSFLISFVKFLSIKFQWKLCFIINEFLIEKL